MRDVRFRQELPIRKNWLLRERQTLLFSSSERKRTCPTYKRAGLTMNGGPMKRQVVLTSIAISIALAACNRSHTATANGTAVEPSDSAPSSVATTETTATTNDAPAVIPVAATAPGPERVLLPGSSVRVRLLESLDTHRN